MTDARLAAQSALLAEVFPGASVSEPTYLRWLYRYSPFGPVIAADLIDDDGLAGHYAVVPVTLSVNGTETPAALSLNTAVHERARGGGVFVRLAEEAYATATSLGIEHVIGVANANSTPGFLRRLGFVDLGQLPVTVLIPSPGRRGDGRSVVAAEAGPLLEDARELLSSDTGVHWSRTWTPETLRWRLAAPGASYVVHRVGGALAISTVERRGPVRIAVILAIFASADQSARQTRATVREICRAHRAPVALHAGHNPRLRWRGLALPDRLRPSPLNLIARALGAARPLERPGRFEFIDFDAY